MSHANVPSPVFQRVAAIVGQPDATFLVNEGVNLQLFLQTMTSQDATEVWLKDDGGPKSEEAVEKMRGILRRLIEKLNPNVGVKVATRDNVIFELVPSKFEVEVLTPTNGKISFMNCYRNMNVFKLLSMCYDNMPEDERATPLCDYRFVFVNGGGVLKMTQTFGEHNIMSSKIVLKIISKKDLRQNLLVHNPEPEQQNPDKATVSFGLHIVVIC